MRSDNGGTREYVLGHSEGELTRLERQAEIFAEPTEQLLRRAGIGRGMRVLDIGCGVGDVAMAAARLVGPSGAVLGIDRAGEALGTAAKRAERAGLTWLSFRPSDLNEFQTSERFDAIKLAQVDLLCGADTVTLARRADVAFSIPIFPGGIGALTRADAFPRFPGFAGSALAAW